MISDFLRTAGRIVIWQMIAILSAALYGVVNDQITLTLSPEYFTVFKHSEFYPLLQAFGQEDAPVRIEALIVGTAATWWFGCLLGMFLGVAGTLGRRPRMTTATYLRAIGQVMLMTAVVSVTFGLIADLTEPWVNPSVADWPFLDGITAIRPAFAVGWWHNGAYAGALAGTVWACRRVRKQRLTTPLATAGRRSP